MKFKEFYILKERAFHGSAQKIKGKFSYDKIGSGHGAQAFGYGFYFSESKSVASSYKANSYKAYYEYKGKDSSFWYNFFSDRGDYVKAEIWERIMLHKSKNSIREAIIESEADDEDLKYLDSLPDSLFAPAAGGLYEIELNTTFDELLDWHKLFNEQPLFVRRKLKSKRNIINKGYDYRYSVEKPLENMTGQEIYYALKEAFSISEKYGGLEKSQHDVSNKKDKNASLFLYSIGIKGIAYTAYIEGEDKKNIVMFSPDDITVINEL